MEPCEGTDIKETYWGGHFPVCTKVYGYAVCLKLIVFRVNHISRKSEEKREEDPTACQNKSIKSKNLTETGQREPVQRKDTCNKTLKLTLKRNINLYYNQMLLVTYPNTKLKNLVSKNL